MTGNRDVDAEPQDRGAACHLASCDDILLYEAKTHTVNMGPMCTTEMKLCVPLHLLEDSHAKTGIYEYNFTV